MMTTRKTLRSCQDGVLSQNIRNLEDSKMRAISSVPFESFYRLKQRGTQILDWERERKREKEESPEERRGKMRISKKTNTSRPSDQEASKQEGKYQWSPIPSILGHDDKGGNGLIKAHDYRCWQIPIKSAWTSVASVIRKAQPEGELFS